MHAQPILAEQRTLSMILAVTMHGLIGLMLYFGVQWQTRPAAPVEVELWAGAMEAAPLPVKSAEPISTPAVAVKAEVLPEPTPPSPVKPDIALEAPKPKQEPKPKPEPKPEAPPAPAKKVEAPKKAAQETASSLLGEIAKQSAKAEGHAKQANDKAGKLKEQPRDATASLAALAARQQAAEASANAKAFDAYLSLVRNKIRRNMNYPDDGSGNPEALLEVRLLPDMSVMDVKILRASGVAAFDEAVKRAILRTGQYPPLPQGIDFASLRQHKLKYQLNDAR